MLLYWGMFTSGFIIGTILVLAILNRGKEE